MLLLGSDCINNWSSICSVVFLHLFYLIDYIWNGFSGFAAILFVFISCVYLEGLHTSIFLEEEEEEGLLTDSSRAVIMSLRYE